MEYKIIGNQLPAVICTLEAGESLITEAGAMSWMTDNMRMETKGGGMRKMFGRMLSGESMFQNIYTAEGRAGEIAFASSFPGAIMAVDVSREDIVAQKSAFLAAERSVELSMFFQKKMGAGFVGGEGFIMQRLGGHGIAFLEIDGAVQEYELAPGQRIIVDTGSLAYMSASCSIDVQTVKGAKNMFFGGEGIFNTVITGPGKLGLQTLSAQAVANTIIPFLPADRS